MSKRRILVLHLAFLVFTAIPPVVYADMCFECHSGWEDESGSPSASYESDVHFRAGLGCADCHGGNPELDDMDDVRRGRGYKGIPRPREIPGFCATCHNDPGYMIKHNPALPTDQLDKYKTSVHGKRLLEEGDEKAANCVSCHSVHNIERPQIPASTVYPLNLPEVCAGCHSDPEYMAGYGIPASQFDDYAESVHGHALLVEKDLGAPACNDCHGNHGATPPGVTSISAVCGLCHALISDEFAVSPHKAAFDEMGYPECEGCHSNHLVLEPELYWIGTSDSSLCVDCHSADDGTEGLAKAEKIHEIVLKLKKSYETAEAKVDESELKGMMVTDERFILKEITQAMIRTRTVIHSLDFEKVSEAAGEGLEKADQAYRAATTKVEEYYFRRKGLGIATLIITILVIALYLRIRSIDKSHPLR
ncbi:MAG: cytochrome c3 family protein [Candidatus Zixiibacteriota bacterium]|nr:MAG: cytochrome c3 family protein [candidate division Zixibacteria bacterium]